MKTLATAMLAAWLLGFPGTPAFAQDAAATAAPTLIVDGDDDGVSDEVDDCPYTPQHVPVDVHGCPVGGDGDSDGIPDAIDDCPYTMKGAMVDPHGCALDGDLDGVPDGMDRCPHSTYGERVDAQGCEPGTVVPSPPAKTPLPKSRVPAAPTAPKPAAPQVRIQPVPVSPEPPVVSSPPVAISPPSPSPQARRLPPPPQVVLPANRSNAVPLPPPLPAPAVDTPATPQPATAVEPAVTPRMPATTAPGIGARVAETLGSVRFGRNSVEFSEVERQKLQHLVDELRPRLAQLQGSTFFLSGNQQTGDAADLGQRRVEVIRSYLVSRGISGDRIRVNDTAITPRKDASGQTVLIQLLPSG